MKDKNTDSVQNRFTAYLMAAVGNKRISYIERKIRQHEREQVQVDLLEKNHTDFDAQFHAYMMEKTATASGDWEILRELRALAESERLIKALGRLKERDRGILFARVFEELTFSELGEKFRMEPKQAEMAYYYILRKLRKELEGKNGF